MRAMVLSVAMLALAACSNAPMTSQSMDGTADTVIFTAKAFVSMVSEGDTFEAVAVQNGRIAGVGTLDALHSQFPDASVDTSFANQTIIPGLIDPHVHVMLGSLQYNLPLTPPWPMATANGMVAGLGTREAFLQKVSEIEAETPADQTLIIYGYHNLIHGDLTRDDLDAITTTRALVIWHYSSHDFYLNSAAIQKAGFTPALAEKFHGVDLNQNGELTGRIYEDAASTVAEAFADVVFNPENVSAGMKDFSRMLNVAGVTTIAEMGYGIFGWQIEDANIRANWGSPDQAGYRLYLVPEHRALQRSFGSGSVQAVKDMLDGTRPTPAPVLPRVKFFTDAAYYSQTMRLSPPGYLSGQSKGSEGLWVLPPDKIAETIKPYWDQGLNVNIHSNGDAAQTATLDALNTLRTGGTTNDFVIEHGGLFSPEQVVEVGRLNAKVSAASHYVYYMSGIYAAPLGEPRARWISPLGALSAAGADIAVHSDAPLAPPQPLRAAGVHISRATREGGTYEASMALKPYDALAAVTLDAARVLGLDAEIGSIERGKRADFTVLGANPLELPGDKWADIPIWGVVLEGQKRPLAD